MKMNDKIIERFKESKEAIDNNQYQKALSILKSIYKYNPTDIYTSFSLANLLLRMGKIDDAKIIIEQIINSKYNKASGLYLMGKLKLNESKFDEAFSIFSQLLNTKFKVKAILYLTYIYIKKEKYSEAYELCIKENIFSDPVKNRGEIKFLLENYLGIESDSEIKNSYFCKQVKNYDEKYAIYHIKKHLEKNTNKKNHDIFYNDVDIEKLYYYAKEKIEKINPLVTAFSDRYDIDCKKPIANINHKDTSYVSVITIFNTKNILTIYPTVSYNEKEIITDSKILKLESQIDKFNKKYNLK